MSSGMGMILVFYVEVLNVPLQRGSKQRFELMSCVVSPSISIACPDEREHSAPEVSMKNTFKRLNISTRRLLFY